MDKVERDDRCISRGEWKRGIEEKVGVECGFAWGVVVVVIGYLSV